MSSVSRSGEAKGKKPLGSKSAEATAALAEVDAKLKDAKAELKDAKAELKDAKAEREKAKAERDRKKAALVDEVVQKKDESRKEWMVRWKEEAPDLYDEWVAAKEVYQLAQEACVRAENGCKSAQKLVDKCTDDIVSQQQPPPTNALLQFMKEQREENRIVRQIFMKYRPAQAGGGSSFGKSAGAKGCSLRCIANPLSLFEGDGGERAVLTTGLRDTTVEEELQLELGSHLAVVFEGTDIVVVDSHAQDCQWLAQNQVRQHDMRPDYFFSLNGCFVPKCAREDNLSSGERKSIARGVFPHLKMHPEAVVLSELKPKKLGGLLDGSKQLICETCAADECIGEVWDYMDLQATSFPGTAVVPIIRGVALFQDGFALVTRYNAVQIGLQFCSYLTPGSARLLRDHVCAQFIESRWIRALRSLLTTELKGYSLASENAFLGAGSFGRVFAVEKKDRVYALKIVINHADRLRGEHDVLSRLGEEYALAGTATVPIVGEVVENKCGAGFLMGVIGCPVSVPKARQKNVIGQILESLAAIHKAGYTHGDARLKNVIAIPGKEGVQTRYLFCDCVTSRSCFTREQKKRRISEDVTCLLSSISGVLAADIEIIAVTKYADAVCEASENDRRLEVSLETLKTASYEFLSS